MPDKTTGAATRDILDELKKRRVRFLLLQFTDLLGVNKAVEIPASQFERALAGDVVFDGSALEGFARVEEADALLVPDRESFRVFPWGNGGPEGGDEGMDGAVARLICDIRYPDSRPFEGCPRTTLKRQIDHAAKMGYTMADQLATLRFVVRTIAVRHGLIATFMPKPIYGRNGSGMHTHQSLFAKGKNAFLDPAGPIQLSDVGRWYIGGLLRHARGYCAVTNPLVNSYKRLGAGDEAPVNVSWSPQNVSPLIRVPAQRGEATRCENRMPDPCGNPYLAIAVQLAAGLDGIQERIDPGEPVNKNIARMSYRERRKFRIDDLPRDLHEALDYLEKDAVVREALGEHIYERYLDAKREEWQEYIGQVGEWELNRYLGQY